MKNALAVIGLSSFLLTGCSAVSAATSSAPASSVSASASTRSVPGIVGDTPGQAENILNLSGIDYDYFQGGVSLTVGSGHYDSFVITSTEPAAGETLPAGGRLKINVSPNRNDPALAAAPSSSPTATPKSAPTGYAATVPAKFPGYPLIVHAATLDYRVKFAFEGKLVDDQVVALAPGLYTPYNPHVPDLASYYAHSGVYGDSAIKDAYMPDAGGATWDGVLPGPEEPK
ncbi:PASTA domain-containing protein [Arthrobacter bambusae]|uniref:PASTA domain-containing protein n=1 Tax=Arthrobacter bambusae TaxID=1338426 RepID=UPI002787A37D|nr:PASTA domain-containing protein [Arthrobacter bambusae]MDQ0212558.1 hypothetical protein [Arthrobacter bambusae]MDQ0236940.1 hypothetical protein [Arthrobacter bambusae]